MDLYKINVFQETKARRAARKSMELGYLVRAPNLSNINEASEFQNSDRSKSAGLSRGPTPNPHLAQSRGGRGSLDHQATEQTEMEEANSVANKSK